MRYLICYEYAEGNLRSFETITIEVGSPITSREDLAEIVERIYGHHREYLENSIRQVISFSKFES